MRICVCRPVAHAQSGKFDEMLLLLDKMAEKGVPPSLAVFKVVLESCLRSRKADRVSEIPVLRL